MRITGPTTWALLVLAASACEVGLKAGSFEDDKRAALAALDVLHQRYNAEDFEAIYENAAVGLRALPRDEVLLGMRETRRRLGRFIRGEVKASSCFPNEVRFIVQATYEKGEAGEMIVWSVPGRDATLLSFAIFPGTMDVPAGSSNECRSGP